MSLSREKAELLIELVGKDNVTALLQKVNAEQDKATAGARGWKAALDDVKGSWQVMAMSINSVLGIADRVVGAFRSMGAALKDAASERALEEQFRRTFIAADELGEKLKAATGGQLADDVYMPMAVRLREAGLAAGQIERFLNLSVKAANAMGQEVAQTTERLVDGITRGNDKSLKSVGINADISRELAMHARSVGKTVEELTLAERQAFNLDIQVKKLTETYGKVDIESSAIAQRNRTAERWNDYWDNRKAEFLDFVTWASEMDERIRNLGATSNWVPEAFREEMAARDERKRALDEEYNAILRSKEAQYGSLKALADEVNKLKESKDSRLAHNLLLAAAAMNMGELTVASRLYTEASRAMEAATKGTTKSLKEQVDELQRGRDAAIQQAIALAAIASANRSPMAAELWKKAGSLLGWKDKGGGKGGGGGGKSPFTPQFGTNGTPMSGDLDSGTSTDNPEYFELPGEAGAMAAEAKAAARRVMEDARRETERAGLVWEQFLGDFEANRERDASERLKALVGDGRDAITNALGRIGSDDPKIEWVKNLAGEVDEAIVSFSHFADIIDTARTANLGLTQQMVQGAPAAISAIGKVAKVFGASAAWQYGIEGVAELAAVYRSYPDPIGMAIHGIGAATYFAAAAMAGGSPGGSAAAAASTVGRGPAGGSGGTGARVPSGFGPAGDSSSRVFNVNVVMAGGNFYADDPKLYEKLANGIAKHVGKFKYH